MKNFFTNHLMMGLILITAAFAWAPEDSLVLREVIVQTNPGIISLPMNKSTAELDEVQITSEPLIN